MRGTKSRSDYVQAHKKVRKLHGSASLHRCYECGEPAAEWAFQHPEGFEPEWTTAGRPFSNNPEHYAAMCRRCHQIMDKGKNPEVEQRRIAVSIIAMRHMANTRRNICDVCALVASPGGLATHQKATGHVGWVGL